MFDKQHVFGHAAPTRRPSRAHRRRQARRTFKAFTRRQGVEGVYLTWMISALALGVVLLPVYAPPWSRLTLSGFVDFIRRYWVHVLCCS